MKIKDSELNRIIKDSCEYLYKNHTELDNIIRLTKQGTSFYKIRHSSVIKDIKWFW
jgi:hypothetical protein